MYTVVVPLRRMRCIGTARVAKLFAAIVAAIWAYKVEAGRVAEVVFMPAVQLDGTVPPVAANATLPHTSQSPAVRLMLAVLAGVALVREIAPEVLGTYSPMLPAFALSFVAVPTMPAVLDGVIVLVAWSVVNLPAAAVVDPIEPGAANVAPPSVAALTAVLQVKPVLVV